MHGWYISNIEERYITYFNPAMTKNRNFSSDTSDSLIGGRFNSYELGTITAYMLVVHPLSQTQSSQLKAEEERKDECVVI